METVFCQSCAMPMDNEQLYGTNADGSKTSEYCYYCYADGQFTADLNLEEMIEACLAPMIESNADMTEDKARSMMRQIFPTLKRWKA